MIGIRVQCLVQTVDGRWVQAVGYCDLERWTAFDARDVIDNSCVPVALYKIGVTSINGWADYSGEARLKRICIRDDLDRTSFPEGPPEDIEHSG